MSVELPVFATQPIPPKPPRAIVWLGLFVTCMLINGVVTLSTWPETDPASSALFWVRLLACPTLAWSLAFGLRLYYYEEETARLAAEAEALARDRETAVNFAREPLAVVGYAYLCSLGKSKAAITIAQGKAELGASTPHSGGEAIRHTALTLSEDPKAPGRYRACFVELLDLIAEKLTALPCDAPLTVCLNLSPEMDRTPVLEAWEQCWQGRGLRPAQASLLPAGQGLMALDKWLDLRGGPALENFTLFVSVQLHDAPPQNSAEAAVALLLGWAPLAERRSVKPLAMLHRPVEATSEIINDIILTALVWGRATAPQINNLWEAGLKKTDRPSLIQTASDLSLGVSRTDQLCGIHDIDAALGDAGATAGWLAVALAIEHAAQTSEPQLAAYREGTMRFVVIQPLAQTIAEAKSEQEMVATA